MLYDPVAIKLRAFLRTKRVRSSISSSGLNDVLRCCRRTSPEFVIVPFRCAHAGNVLIAPTALSTLDWDNPILAPKNAT